MSKFFFLAKTAINNPLWKVVYTIDDNIILVSDTVVMIGSFHDFLEGSTNNCGTFDDTIITCALDTKRKCLILALNNSTIWCLCDGTKLLIGEFESPHLICVDHFSRAMVIASMHGMVSWWQLDQVSINNSLKVRTLFNHYRLQHSKNLEFYLTLRLFIHWSII